MLESFQDTADYHIVRKIAEGGMGSVYEALQRGVEGFEKRVAIKTLLQKFTSSEQLNQMFIQEAKLVADLVHENIVQIYQFNRGAEHYYIVMEYVNGLSLREFIDGHRSKNKRIPKELAVFIASRIARGLAYAHTRLDDYGKPKNIVHRDVSTKNVLITTEGLPKLADFGLALVPSAAELKKKRPIVGNFFYISPEQAQAPEVDFRSDQYALGALLFEMLSNAGIRKAQTKEELIKLAREGKVLWERLPRDTDTEVKAILERCLALDRNERYEATSLLARALEYHIYKSGYGPTIQTLEEYMRGEFPELYRLKSLDAT